MNIIINNSDHSALVCGLPDMVKFWFSSRHTGKKFDANNFYRNEAKTSIRLLGAAYQANQEGAAFRRNGSKSPSKAPERGIHSTKANKGPHESTSSNPKGTK